MQLRTLTAIGCIAVTLAACGGGGGSGNFGLASPGGTTAPGDGSAPTTTSSTSVPASVFQGVDAFIAYVRGLAADETSEPLTLPAGAAPTSDTTEPAG